jgi:hypothetical protein
MGGNPPFALSSKNRNNGIFVYKKEYECKDRQVSQFAASA